MVCLTISPFRFAFLLDLGVVFVISNFIFIFCQLFLLDWVSFVIVSFIFSFRLVTQSWLAFADEIFWIIFFVQEMICCLLSFELLSALQWRHNGRDSVSNHQPHDCLLNCLLRRRSKKTSKLRVTGLCAGNSPGTGQFPAQMASNAENVSIWWLHHVN